MPNSDWSIDISISFIIPQFAILRPTILQLIIPQPAVPALEKWSSTHENDNYMIGLTNFESVIELLGQAMQNAMTLFIST